MRGNSFPHRYRGRFLFMFLQIVIQLLCGCTNRTAKGYDQPVYGGQGFKHFCEGDFRAALDDYKSAYLYTGKFDRINAQTGYLFNIGRVYFEMGKIDSCITVMKSARENYLKLGDTVNASVAAGFLSLCFATKNFHDSVWSWYENGHALSVESQRSFWLTIRARVLWIADKNPQSLVFLDSAANIYTKKNDKLSIALNLLYRAEVLFAKGNATEAESLLKESLVKFDSVNEQYRRWKVLIMLAKVSWCLGKQSEAQGYYDRAIQCMPQIFQRPAFGEIKECGCK